MRSAIRHDTYFRGLQATYEESDLLNRMRESCLEAYTGIISAFGENKEGKLNICVHRAPLHLTSHHPSDDIHLLTVAQHSIEFA